MAKQNMRNKKTAKTPARTSVKKKAVKSKVVPAKTTAKRTAETKAKPLRRGTRSGAKSARSPEQGSALRKVAVKVLASAITAVRDVRETVGQAILGDPADTPNKGKARPKKTKRST